MTSFSDLCRDGVRCHWLDAFQRDRGPGRTRARARRVRERRCGRAPSVVRGDLRHRPPVAPATSIGGCLAESRCRTRLARLTELRQEEHAPPPRAGPRPRSPPASPLVHLSATPSMCSRQRTRRHGALRGPCRSLFVLTFVKVSRQLARVSGIRTDARREPQEAPVDAGTRNGQRVLRRRTRQ